MSAGSETRRDAGIYVRQSSGKERSIDEQETDSRRDCEAQGWAVREVYADLTSASRFARKDRPDWDRLLRDLEQKRIGVLVMWESSRGDRTLSSWSGLLERCRDHAILIHVVSHGRTYDMANARDWRTLAEDGVDNAYESERISQRVKRAMSANATAGKPHGVTLYGYERIYHPRTRELQEQRPHINHAPIVAELFRRVAEGDPLSRIAEDLNRRGIPSPRGAKWGRATIRQTVTNPGYIGKRASGTKDKPRQVLYDAAWPALVDELTYYAVQRRLSDPARKVTHPGRYKWLLSYLARCGECGAHLSAFGGGRYYGCSEQGCVYILREPLDLYVTESMLRLVRERDAIAVLSTGDDEEVTRARAEVEELGQRLDAYARQAARGEIGERALGIITAELAPLIKAAQARAQAAVIPPALRRLAAAGEHAEAVWKGMPVAAQREVVDMAYTIAVRRATRKVPRGALDTGRVKMKLREG